MVTDVSMVTFKRCHLPELLTISQANSKLSTENKVLQQRTELALGDCEKEKEVSACLYQHTSKYRVRLYRVISVGCVTRHLYRLNSIGCV